MENINIKKARELLYSSAILKYVSKEQIEEELKNIYIHNSEEEFNKACGVGELIAGGKLHAFNRNGQNHFNPKYVTPHKIIHEVLHGLSKKYDANGKQIENGIQGSKTYEFAVQVNEGLTDFLAARISGEPQNYFIEGKMLFEPIEQALIKEFNDENILFDIYINNRVDLLESFLDKYAGNGTFENIYTNFLFLDKTKIGAITNKINKNFKRTQIINKIKSIFKINKTKKLPQAITEKEETLQNGHTQFVNKCAVEDYKYPDLEEFNKKQQNIQQKPKTK